MPESVDSHQHVHREEPLRSILLAIARELAIPLRECSPAVRYCGGFYGQTGRGAPLPELISVERLLEFLAALPPGVTELGCHPGEGNDLDTMYGTERAVEVQVLAIRACKPPFAPTGSSSAHSTGWFPWRRARVPLVPDRCDPARLPEALI